MTGQTTTTIHNQAQMNAQRWQALAEDRCALCGLSVYAQIFIGLALYLYTHVSTPGYLSILLSLPYALLLLFLARKTAAQSGGQGLVLPRLAAFPFLLLHLFNAQLVSLSLCAILMDAMPEQSLWKMALLLSPALAWANSGRREDALSRLSRFLKWVILVLLGYALVTAFPYGSAAYFFPLLGYGWKSVGQGALWMCGAVSGCVWPLLTPQNSQTLSPMLTKKSAAVKPALLSILAGCGTMLVSVWLMPVYAMSRPETLGWRLMLATNMTPSIPAWSMVVIGILLLFFLSLSYHVTQAAALISTKKEPPSGWLLLFLMLLLTPCSVLQFPDILETLSRIALFRGPLTLSLLLLLSIRGKKQRKEGAAA